MFFTGCEHGCDIGTHSNGLVRRLLQAAISRSYSIGMHEDLWCYSQRKQKRQPAGVIKMSMTKYDRIGPAQFNTQSFSIFGQG